MSDEPQVPDLADAIVAVRQWNVRDGGLYGNGGIVWPPSVPLRARCVQDHGYYNETPRLACDEAPCSPSVADSAHYGHGCGIYARKGNPFKSVTALSYDTDAYSEDDSVVYGEVRLWGKVYEYEEGYRAEFAEVSCLYDSGPHVELIAETYDVDVMPWPVESKEERIERLREEAARQDERWQKRQEAAKADPPKGSTPQPDADPADPNDLGGGITIGLTEWKKYPPLQEWVVYDAGEIVARKGNYITGRYSTTGEKRWRREATEAAERYRYKRDHPIRKAQVALAILCVVGAIVNAAFVGSWVMGGVGGWWNAPPVALSIWCATVNWRMRRG